MIIERKGQKVGILIDGTNMQTIDRPLEKLWDDWKTHGIVIMEAKAGSDLNETADHGKVIYPSQETVDFIIGELELEGYEVK